MTTTSDVDVSVSAASPAWSRVRKFLAGVVNTLFVWHARSSDRRRLLVMHQWSADRLGLTTIYDHLLSPERLRQTGERVA